MKKTSPFTDEIRDAIKTRGKAGDVAYLLAWMLTHYTDDGAIRSPQARRRLAIVLDGVRYVLVRSESKTRDARAGGATSAALDAEHDAGSR